MLLDETVVAIIWRLSSGSAKIPIAYPSPRTGSPRMQYSDISNTCSVPHQQHIQGHGLLPRPHSRRAAASGTQAAAKCRCFA